MDMSVSFSQILNVSGATEVVPHSLTSLTLSSTYFDLFKILPLSCFSRSWMWNISLSFLAGDRHNILSDILWEHWVGKSYVEFSSLEPKLPNGPVGVSWRSSIPGVSAAQVDTVQYLQYLQLWMSGEKKKKGKKELNMAHSSNCLLPNNIEVQEMDEFVFTDSVRHGKRRKMTLFHMCYLLMIFYVYTWWNTDLFAIFHKTTNISVLGDMLTERFYMKKFYKVLS